MPASQILEWIDNNSTSEDNLGDDATLDFGRYSQGVKYELYKTI
jgi:hypothetical protein